MLDTQSEAKAMVATVVFVHHFNTFFVSLVTIDDAMVFLIFDERLPLIWNGTCDQTCGLAEACGKSSFFCWMTHVHQACQCLLNKFWCLSADMAGTLQKCILCQQFACVYGAMCLAPNCLDLDIFFHSTSSV